jgi:hypothetical protein
LDQGKEVESPTGKSFRVLAVRAAPARSTSPIRIIHVALDRTFEEDLLARYRRNMVLVLGLALVVCALAGYRIARRGLQPVAEITATARRIRATTLDERLEVHGLPAELFVARKRLTTTLSVWTMHHVASRNTFPARKSYAFAGSFEGSVQAREVFYAHMPIRSPSGLYAD